MTTEYIRYGYKNCYDVSNSNIIYFPTYEEYDLAKNLSPYLNGRGHNKTKKALTKLINMVKEDIDYFSLELWKKSYSRWGTYNWFFLLDENGAVEAKLNGVLKKISYDNIVDNDEAEASEFGEKVFVVDIKYGKVKSVNEGCGFDKSTHGQIIHAIRENFN